MSKLYLVRKNLEMYLGPMSIEEFKSGYKKMKFSLDDEVSSSLSSWVKLSDQDKMKRRYPELVSVLEKESIWNVSAVPVDIIDNHSEKRKSSSEKKGLIWWMVVFALIPSLVLLGIYLYMDENSSSKRNDEVLSEVSSLIENKKESEFLERMDSLIPVILPEVIRNKGLYTSWIPYLRYYAFEYDGAIVGLKSQMLRGKGNFVAPKDCSVEFWKNKLSSTHDWETFLSGKSYSNSYINKIFLWDPFWIKVRKDSLWIYPINYYEACLITALKVIENDRLYLNEQQRSILSNRLRFMITTIDFGSSSKIGKDSYYNKKGSNILDILSCMEMNEESCGIEKLKGNKNDNFFIKYESNRKNRINLSYSLSSIFNKESIGQEEIDSLSKLKDNLKMEDYLTQLNYYEEYQIINYFQQGETVKDVKKKLAKLYSESFNQH